jgi:hypothetical protein
MLPFRFYTPTTHSFTQLPGIHQEPPRIRMTSTHTYGRQSHGRSVLGKTCRAMIPKHSTMRGRADQDDGG